MIFVVTRKERVKGVWKLKDVREFRNYGKAKRCAESWESANTDKWWDDGHRVATIRW